jgi:hypothetical protein
MTTVKDGGFSMKNKRSIHSTLGYKTINEFETEMYNQIVAA